MCTTTSLTAATQNLKDVCKEIQVIKDCFVSCKKNIQGILKIDQFVVKTDGKFFVKHLAEHQARVALS